MRSVLGFILGIGVGMALWVLTGHFAVGVGVAAGLAFLFGGVALLHSARV